MNNTDDTEKKLFKIKEFASIFGLTVKALKVYEQDNIFFPAYIDKNTGYRYYTSDQMYELSYILSLKSLNYTHKEIHDFLKNKFTLMDKYNNLLEQKKTLDLMLDIYDVYLNKNINQVKIKEIDEHYAFNYTCIVSNIDDAIKVFSQFNNLIISKGLNLKKGIRAYAVFHDEEIKFQDINMSFRSIIEKPKKINNEIIKVLKQKVISVIHYGSYETIYETYEVLYSYAKNNDIEIIGDAMEFYLSSSYAHNISNSFITEVCIPINIK